MNTIFIDINDMSKCKSETKLTLKEKIIKFIQQKLNFALNIDMFNGRFSNIFYLNIDKKLLANYTSKNSLIKKIFEKYIKFKLDKLSYLNFVFSEEFENYTSFKRYLFDIFSNSDIKINEIVCSNGMLQNDLEYMDDYVNVNKVKLNRVKLLIVLNNIDDFNKDKIIEYISRYKFVDILRLKDINKYDYAKLQQSVNDINNEYGTTIEIIQKRNIQAYTFYLINSNIQKEYFVTQYVLSTKGKYIDLKDADEDIYNPNMIAYERHKQDIFAIFNRLEIDIKKYKKNKLGYLYLDS